MNLTLSKTVTGNMGSKIKKFDFTVKLEEKDGESGYKPLSGDFKVEDQDGTVTQHTLDENGEMPLTLTHADSLTILGVPLNAKVTVTEADYSSDGYVLTDISVTEDGSETAYYLQDGVVNTILNGLSSNSNGTRSLEMELKKDTSVSFTNEREAIIPTGAYVPGFLFEGILTILLGGYVGFLYYRRKRDDVG